MSGPSGVEPSQEVALGSVRFDPARAPSRLPRTLAARDDEPSGPTTAWLVQVHEPLTRAQQEHLRGAFGLRLTDLVPRFAYVEELDPARAAQVATDDLVRAVVPLDPALRTHPGVLARREQDDDTAPVLLLAVLLRGADPAATVAALEAAGATSVAATPRSADAPAVVKLRAPLALAPALAAVEGVRWVEPAPVVVDDEPGLAAAMLFRPGPGVRADVPAELDGRGEVIGVIDNGRADLAHTFFADDVEPGPTHRKVVQLRDGTGSQAPGAHATFVAGCAAGDDRTAPGAAPWRGAAPGARLALGNRNDLASFATVLGGPARTLAQELGEAAAVGARVHSHSFHTVPPVPGAPVLYDVMAADVDRFTWTDEDAVVVGSAGNTGETQGSPGTAKNALCVAAATADEPEPRLGDGASGPTPDDRAKPDLLATACGVQSALAGTGSAVGPRSPCASSYATPFAAAAAAIVRQYLRDGWHPGGRPGSGPGLRPTGALVRAVLVAGAEPVGDDDRYPSPVTGFGLLRLRRALALDGDVRRLALVDVRHADGLATGEEAVHTVEVDASRERLDVVLAWTDPPGVTGAEDPVVNDLDLGVVAPDGTVRCGNAVRAGVSEPGPGRADRRHTVERVGVERPEPGVWRVVVRASAVNVGVPGQGYAVVVAGGVREG